MAPKEKKEKKDRIVPGTVAATGIPEGGLVQGRAEDNDPGKSSGVRLRFIGEGGLRPLRKAQQTLSREHQPPVPPDQHEAAALPAGSLG